MPAGHQALIRLGGKPAVGLFVLTLLAFVTETQLSQYVQADLGFRQPFLIFYIVHSSFALLFPLHLLYLCVFSQYSLDLLWISVLDAVRRHLAPRAANTPAAKPAFPTGRFYRLLACLTTGLTLPGLMWFIAVTLAPYTSVTDVTALWNTNAFFAYVLTVLITRSKWDPRRLVAVLIATGGVLAVVYGGTTVEAGTSSTEQSLETEPRAHRAAPLVGDLLTLAASIIYAAYQVLYKIHAALPDDPEVQADLYTPIPEGDSLDEDEEVALEAPLLVSDDIIHPLPFGLYPNFLTSAIGVCTMLVLWIPVPIIHALDIEPFEMPQTGATYGVIAGIALTGAIFNAGFMVLLGVWGPIVTSVGSLLTIVLVFVSDAIFGGAVEAVTIWSVLGCGSIVAAFSILAYDLAKRR